MAQLDLNSPVAVTNFLASGATFQATEGSNSDFHDGEKFDFYDRNSSDLVDFFKL